MEGPFDYATNFTDLPLRQWSEIETDEGGCAYGEAFSFWVYPGDPNRLIVEFSGGGACWNEFTCMVEANLFDASVDDDRERFASVRPPGLTNHTNPRNPFRDWTHIYIPYCTGDVHVGTKQTTYGALQINHYGGINARNAIDWAERANLPVERLLVGGCSAGGYASALWSPHLFDMYPDAAQTQLNDSAMGVVGDTFTTERFALWTDDLPLPSWVTSTEPSIVGFIADLYGATGRQYPSSVISHFTTTEDAGQLTVYGLTQPGVSTADFAEKQLANMRRYRDASESYHYYLAEGTGHCVIAGSGYYAQRAADDVFFRDWLEGIEARTIEEDVVCTGCEPL